MSNPIEFLAKDSARPDQHPRVTPKFAVQHYTVAEIAGFWKLSADTIRKLFENEPDVLVIESPKPRYGSTGGLQEALSVENCRFPVLDERPQSTTNHRSKGHTSAVQEGLGTSETLL